MEHNIDESKRKEIEAYIDSRRHRHDYVVSNMPQLAVKMSEIIKDAAEKFDVPYEYVKEMVIPSDDMAQA